MKICLVNTFHYRRGGDSTYTLDLSDLLESKGHQVIHFAMKHPQNLPSKWDKYFADHIDFSVIFRNGSIAERTRAFLRSLYSFEVRRRFAKLLDDTQPEIIHLQNFRRHLTFSLLEEAKKREIPVVLTAHDYDPICPNSLLLASGKVCEACKNFKYYKAIFRRCKENSFLGTAAITMEGYFVLIRGYYSKIDLIIAPSDFLRSKLIEFKFDPKKIVHLPNFINSENFEPSFGGNGFIYFGRIAREKGLESLLKAASFLPDVKVTIAGGGPYEQKVLELKASLSCKNVHLTGHLGKQELAAEIRKSIAVVLPSICYENCPYSLLEAFAYGKPVIATRIGGIPEMVTQGENGLLIEPGDWVELKNHMSYLSQNPEVAKRMGTMARKTVETRFHAERHYNSLMELYERAIRREI